MSTLGQRLKAVREAAGLTQRQVADRFGCAWSTVSRWESDEFDPGTQRVGELAVLFGCSAAELAFGEAPTTPSTAAEVAR